MRLNEFIQLAQSLGLNPKQRSNGEWRMHCPAHQDDNPSLDVREGEKGLILICRAGCPTEAICEALGITLKDLFYDHQQTNNRRLTLAQLAETKRLPIDFLRQLGWRDENNAVAIPFTLLDGSRIWQYRHSIDKSETRYTWQKGAKANEAIYGIDDLPENISEAWVTESALDAATLQFAGFGAIAVAGQGNAKAVAHFRERLSKIPTIVVWNEPDAPNFAREIATALGRTVLCVQPCENEPKDANRLWLAVNANREKFLAELSRLRANAVVIEPLNEPTPVEPKETETEKDSETQTTCEFCKMSDAELLSLAEPVLSSPNPLREATERVRSAFGIVGEDANLQLLLLALTTRVFAQPISVLVTGGTGQGKSFLTDAACATLPPCCHRRIVGASARALLFHNIVRGTVLQWLEMPELSGDTIAATILRSILWQSPHETETDYLFVEWTNRGARRRVVKMPRQVGLVTTKVELPKDEQLLSRFLVLEVRETIDKRVAVFATLAQSWNGASPEPSNETLKPLRAFHEWLGRMKVGIKIPFAHALAELFAELPPSERDYRDFSTLLKLVAANAIWNFRKRPHEVNEGSLTVVADIDDYRIVRDLLTPVWGKARSNALSEAEWQVYQALKAREFALTTKEIAEALKISQSAARNRLNALKRKGVVTDENVDGSRSKAWRISENSVITDMLPTVEAVLARWQGDLPTPPDNNQPHYEVADASVAEASERRKASETVPTQKTLINTGIFQHASECRQERSHVANEHNYINIGKDREYGNSLPFAGQSEQKIADAPTLEQKTQQILDFSSVGSVPTHPDTPTLEWFRCPNCGLRQLMSPDSWLLGGKCPECKSDMKPDNPEPDPNDDNPPANLPADANEPTVDTLAFLEREIGFEPAEPTDQIPDSDQPPKANLPPLTVRELANDLLATLRQFQRQSPKHQRCLTNPCPACRAKIRQIRWLERENCRRGLMLLWKRAQQWQGGGAA